MSDHESRARGKTSSRKTHLSEEWWVNSHLKESTDQILTVLSWERCGHQGSRRRPAPAKKENEKKVQKNDNQQNQSEADVSKNYIAKKSEVTLV